MITDRIHCRISVRLRSRDEGSVYLVRISIIVAARIWRRLLRAVWRTSAGTARSMTRVLKVTTICFFTRFTDWRHELGMCTSLDVHRVRGLLVL
jgi:hypothetical protein